MLIYIILACQNFVQVTIIRNRHCRLQNKNYNYNANSTIANFQLSLPYTYTITRIKAWIFVAGVFYIETEDSELSYLIPFLTLCFVKRKHPKANKEHIVSTDIQEAQSSCSSLLSKNPD